MQSADSEDSALTLLHYALNLGSQDCRAADRPPHSRGGARSRRMSQSPPTSNAGHPASRSSPALPPGGESRDGPRVPPRRAASGSLEGRGRARTSGSAFSGQRVRAREERALRQRCGPGRLGVASSLQ